MYQAWGKDKRSDPFYPRALNTVQLSACLAHQLHQAAHFSPFIGRLYLISNTNAPCETAGERKHVYLSPPVTPHCAESPCNINSHNFVHPLGWKRQAPQVALEPFPIPRRPATLRALACARGAVPANQVSDHRPASAPRTWQEPITAAREPAKAARSGRVSRAGASLGPHSLPGTSEGFSFSIDLLICKGSS